MNKLLHDPKKRTLLLGGGAAVLLVLFLALKGKAKAAAPAGETVSTTGGINPATGLPYAQELAAAQAGGGGISGGGGGANNSGLESALTQLGQNQQTLQTQIEQSHQEDIKALEQIGAANNTAISSLGTSLQGLMSTGINNTPTTSAAPGPAPTNPTPGPTPSQHPSTYTNQQPGNPRAGDKYKIEHYKGKTVHVYEHAVPGGEGPHKNKIVV